MVHNIPLTALNPHPENANQMDVQTFRKLRRFIERTGRYEPLVIRPKTEVQASFRSSTGTIGYVFFRLLGILQRSALCGIQTRIKPVSILPH